MVVEWFGFGDEFDDVDIFLWELSNEVWQVLCGDDVLFDNVVDVDVDEEFVDEQEFDYQE